MWSMEPELVGLCLYKVFLSVLFAGPAADEGRARTILRSMSDEGYIDYATLGRRG